MFTQDESQFILNSINETVKSTGLEHAPMALVIVSKLQAAFQAQQAAAEKLPVVPAEEVDETPEESIEEEK